MSYVPPMTKEMPFRAVGYGDVRVSNRNGPVGILENAERNWVESAFQAHNSSWLTLRGNLAIGNGGICAGDSGGPHFIDVAGVETLAAVTSGGDAACVSMSSSYRLDIDTARSYLAEYVTLP